MTSRYRTKAKYIRDELDAQKASSNEVHTSASQLMCIGNIDRQPSEKQAFNERKCLLPKKQNTGEIAKLDEQPYATERALIEKTITFCKSLACAKKEKAPEQKKEVKDNIPDNAVILARKGNRDEEWYIRPTKNKKHKSKSKKHQIKYDRVTTDLFDQLKLEAPSTTDDIPATLKKLEEKLQVCQAKVEEQKLNNPDSRNARAFASAEPLRIDAPRPAASLGIPLGKPSASFLEKSSTTPAETVPGTLLENPLGLSKGRVLGSVSPLTLLAPTSSMGPRSLEAPALRCGRQELLLPASQPAAKKACPAGSEASSPQGASPLQMPPAAQTQQARAKLLWEERDPRFEPPSPSQLPSCAAAAAAAAAAVEEEASQQAGQVRSSNFSQHLETSNPDEGPLPSLTKDESGMPSWAKAKTSTNSIPGAAGDATLERKPSAVIGFNESGALVANKPQKAGDKPAGRRQLSPRPGMSRGVSFANDNPESRNARAFISADTQTSLVPYNDDAAGKRSGQATSPRPHASRSESVFDMSQWLAAPKPAPKAVPPAPKVAGSPWLQTSPQEFKDEYILPDERDSEPSWTDMVSASNAVLGHQETLPAAGIYVPNSNQYTTDVEGIPNGKPCSRLRDRVWGPNSELDMGPVAMPPPPGLGAHSLCPPSLVCDAKMMLASQLVAMGFLPSVGSMDHESRSCRPCAFITKSSGCRNETTCRFCHLWWHHLEDPKRRKKARKAASGM